MKINLQSNISRHLVYSVKIWMLSKTLPIQGPGSTHGQVITREDCIRDAGKSPGVMND